MKIKIHNSLAKTNSKSEFIFDGLIYFTLNNSNLDFSYNIIDWREFLSFNIETKELIPTRGFGQKKRFSDLTWWKRPDIIWLEMSKEEQNENQTT